MSDLNLENIVGFKAVDKNGNERQVTVDEMTELVSARIVSAASEISTFAAAAAAGTDEFEDQLPQSDTFSWLRTLDGSKNPTLTSSTAAAKVLGGLIGINDTWLRDGGLFKGDLNTIKKSVILRIQEGSTNTPINNGLWGILVTLYTNLGGGQDSSIQIIYYSDGSYYIRSMWYGNWNSWVRITTTAV